MDELVTVYIFVDDFDLDDFYCKKR
jgi:hypothetical protein